MKRIDLNVDVGEGFDFDADLLLFATSANICCGAHAGSWDLTQETIGLALDAHVRIGMHPGYPDRASMGRAPFDPVQAEAYAASVDRQVEQFFNFVPAAYMKPHGAFYNESADAGHPAWRIAHEAAMRFQLPILGLPGTAHERLSPLFIAEGFVDRGYDASGRLLPRSAPGAVLQSLAEIRVQALRLAPLVDSLCLHGDTPGCVEIAEFVVKVLTEAGYEVGA